MEEKRQFVRWNVSVPVRCKTQGTQSELCSRVRDLSNGGLSIDSYVELPFDAQIDLTIDLPDDIGPIQVRGVRLWQISSGNFEAKSFTSGLKFINLSYTDREKIYNYLYKYRRQDILKRWWSAEWSP